MIRTRMASVVLILAAIPAWASPAEGGPQLEPGRFVRVRIGKGASQVSHQGTLVALDEKALTLSMRGSDAPVVVPRPEIHRLDVSIGRHSRFRGAMKGAGLGAGTGAILGFMTGEDDPSGFMEFTRGERALLLAVPGTLVGAVIGAALKPGHRFKPVSADQLRVAVTRPRGGGVGASFSLAF